MKNIHITGVLIEVPIIKKLPITIGDTDSCITQPAVLEIIGPKLFSENLPQGAVTKNNKMKINKAIPSQGIRIAL